MVDRPFDRLHELLSTLFKTVDAKQTWPLPQLQYLVPYLGFSRYPAGCINYYFTNQANPEPPNVKDSQDATSRNISPRYIVSYHVENRCGIPPLTFQRDHNGHPPSGSLLIKPNTRNGKMIHPLPQNFHCH